MIKTGSRGTCKTPNSFAFLPLLLCLQSSYPVPPLKRGKLRAILQVPLYCIYLIQLVRGPDAL